MKLYYLSRLFTFLIKYTNELFPSAFTLIAWKPSNYYCPYTIATQQALSSFSSIWRSRCVTWNIVSSFETTTCEFQFICGSLENASNSRLQRYFGTFGAIIASANFKLTSRFRWNSVPPRINSARVHGHGTKTHIGTNKIGCDAEKKRERITAILRLLTLAPLLTY